MGGLITGTTLTPLQDQSLVLWSDPLDVHALRQTFTPAGLSADQHLVLAGRFLAACIFGGFPM